MSARQQGDTRIAGPLTTRRTRGVLTRSPPDECSPRSPLGFLSAPRSSAGVPFAVSSVARPLLAPESMVSARAATALVLACLIPGLANAQMRETPLVQLTSFGRLSFKVSRGSCSVSPGPDGLSVRLECPDASDDLELHARSLPDDSRVTAWVHRRPRSIVLDLSLVSPVGGYFFEQSGSMVTLDVGERSKRAELRMLADEVEAPLADRVEEKAIDQLDKLFAARRIDDLRKILVKERSGPRPEVTLLRSGDLAFVAGDFDAAKTIYAETTRMYRRRGAGMLAKTRLGEICFFTDSCPIIQDFSFLAPLGARPERATMQAWLLSARLAFWHGDFEEALLRGRELASVGIDPELEGRACRIRDQAFAALLLQAARRANHDQVAEIALTHHDLMASHPAIEILAPVVSDAMMRHELPDQAADVLQALVSGSASDEVVVEYAADLARAYAGAGKLYRATQVVDFALAVGPREGRELDDLRELQARIAVAQRRGRDAVAAVSRLHASDPGLHLLAAESALFHEAGTDAVPVLDRLSHDGVPLGLKAAVELARAEGHLIVGAPDAADLIAKVLERTRPSPETARLAYLRARRLETDGKVEGASTAYAAVSGDPMWERLARVALSDFELAAKAAPPAAPPGKAARARRRPRGDAKTGGSPAGGAPESQPLPQAGPDGSAAPRPAEQEPVKAAAGKTVGDAVVERVEEVGEQQPVEGQPSPADRGEP